MRRLDTERCWWCGAPADSREHRVKKSRIKHLMSTSDLSNRSMLSWSYVGELSDIRGPDAKIVKFGKTMCQNCNNSRSQQFDLAYDSFLEFIYADPWRFRKHPVIDWAQLYDGTGYNQRHLARYFVKNFACRMVESQVTVPGEIIAYMDDITAPAPFNLVPFSDYRLLDAFKRMDLEPDPNYANSGTLRLMEREGDSLRHPEDYDGYIAVLMDGPIGFYFEWRREPTDIDFTVRSISDEGESAILDRRKIPHHLLHDDLDRLRIRLVEVKRERQRKRFGERIQKLWIRGAKEATD